MSLDAIKQISQTESEAGAYRLEKQAEAKKMLAEAEKAGRELLENVRLHAEKESVQMLKKAAEEAENSSKKILSEARAECDALKKDAQKKMKEAKALIVERVVNR